MESYNSKKNLKIENKPKLYHLNILYFTSLKWILQPISFWEIIHMTLKYKSAKQKIENFLKKIENKQFNIFSIVF